MRVLDARKIPYVATEYDASREFHSATDAAQLIGAPVETVYKTLVVLRDPSTSSGQSTVLTAEDNEPIVFAKGISEKDVAELIQNSQKFTGPDQKNIFKGMLQSDLEKTIGRIARQRSRGLAGLGDPDHPTRPAPGDNRQSDESAPD